VNRAIQNSLAGLDHIFFFGSADRHEAIARYEIDPEKTSKFAFGVDTDFWCPDYSLSQSGGILAVGSDPSRDYQTLLTAHIAKPLRIVTRLNVSIPQHVTNVDVICGSLQSSALSDRELRNLYRTAQIVAVPLKDVWQPTGQSVTMQAMACGRPVVLTHGRGLWDPKLLIDGENCLLVPPGDSASWTSAIERLSGDPGLCAQIGAAARKTAVENFSLKHMNDSAEALVHSALKNKAH
jgi:glycosyltransferase involved in cell wall biosynthesis